MLTYPLQQCRLLTGPGLRLSRHAVDVPNTDFIISIASSRTYLKMLDSPKSLRSWDILQAILNVVEGNGKADIAYRFNAAREHYWLNSISEQAILSYSRTIAGGGTLWRRSAARFLS